MANLKVYSSSLDGVQVEANKQEDDTALTWSAGAPHKFANNGRVILHVKIGAGANVLTVVSQATFGGLAVANRTVTLTASETHILGPYPPNVHNETVSATDPGYTSIQFSSVTNLEVVAIRLA